MDFIASGSIPGLLAALCVLLAGHLLFRVGEFLWRFKERKDAVTETGIDNLSQAVEKNTAVTEKLGARIEKLESTLSDVTKVKRDIHRMFMVVKAIAGENWDSILKRTIDEEEALS